MLLKLRNVRLGFADLFEAKSVENGPLSFSADFMIGPDSIVEYTNEVGEKKSVSLVVDEEGDEADSILHKVAVKVAKDKFPTIPISKFKNWVLNKADGSTSRPEKTNQDGEYYSGMDASTWYISAKKREDKAKGGKMVVLDQSREPVGSSKVFSGVYVNALIDVYATDKGGKSVSASLEGVQLLRSGEPLGGAPVDAMSHFGEEEHDESSDGDDVGF